MGKIIKEAITFDDVLLVPAYSEVIPNEVNLETKLTNKIKLNIPFMSASMDTVTGYWWNDYKDSCGRNLNECRH